MFYFPKEDYLKPLDFKENPMAGIHEIEEEAKKYIKRVSDKFAEDLHKKYHQAQDELSDAIDSLGRQAYEGYEQTPEWKQLSAAGGGLNSLKSALGMEKEQTSLTNIIEQADKKIKQLSDTVGDEDFPQEQRIAAAKSLKMMTLLLNDAASEVEEKQPKISLDEGHREQWGGEIQQKLLVASSGKEHAPKAR